LRSIRSFTQILAESLHGTLDADQSDALDRVLSGAVRMTSMIDELFALLRVGADDAPQADVDIARVLADVLESLSSDIERSRARITLGALPTVHTNRLLVDQILQNLIANALKFSGGSAPTIEITAERRPDAWEFAVHDSGVGIPAEDRERVFRLFQRVDHDASGAGVGLALCKRAVEKLGGQIWVRDDERAGTTFCFTIPHRTARSGEANP
jgi:signal transduction histidine kinase